MAIDKERISKLYKKIGSYFIASEDDFPTTDRDRVYSLLISSILEYTYNLCVNLYLDNADSLGLDYDCKAIIEGILIYRIATHELDDMQISLLCYSYSVVDYGDKDKYKHYLKKPYNYPRYIPSDSDKFFDFACLYFNCTKDELIKSGKLKEPYFYLSHSLDEKVDILSYFDRYSLGLDDPLYIYKFFSHNLHPTFNVGPDIFEDYDNKRVDYISKIIDLAESFIEERLLYTEDFEDIPSIDERILINKDYFDDVTKICQFCTRFSFQIPEQLGYYSWYYFIEIGPLLKDMLFSYYFECPYCIVSRYHLTLEMSSIFYYLSFSKKIISIDDRAFREDALIFHSYWDLENNASNKQNISSMMDDIYSRYFKDAYFPIGQREFKMCLKKSSSFVANKEFKSYKPLIDLFLKDYMNNRSRYQRNLYQLSLDLLDGCGNCYDVPYDFKESITICLGNTLTFVCSFIRDFMFSINAHRKRPLKYKREFKTIDSFLNFLDYQSYLSHSEVVQQGSPPDAEA